MSQHAQSNNVGSNSRTPHPEAAGTPQSQPSPSNIKRWRQYLADERAEVVAVKAGRLVEAMRECGCELNNAYMQHSLLALVVIPELRISDMGLIDVTKFARTDVIIA